MSKMRDIIDVPVVETVVRLSDAADSAKSEGVVSEFVLTRQVERNLSMIAQSVKEGIGRGHFLAGPYGSGKSHFLSYVSLVLSGEVTCQNENPLVKAAGGKRFMPLRISLVNVRNDRRLEDAILVEAERYIRAKGAKINLTKKSRFIDYVDSVVRSIDPAGMDEHLRSHNLPVWKKLTEEPDKAAVSAWGYIKTLSGHPGMSEAAPSDLLSQIIKSAKGLGFEGVVIVIDELSEFLRSKPSRAALNEDARYLQLLGEVAQGERLLVVASLQEAIEKTGDIARDVIAKIKDRYPVKMFLDEQHIRELIDGRLVRKKEGARERIRAIWLKYAESLPEFKIGFEDFYRIYPVHPATIRYLEGLKALLSAHRGVVDFIVSQVRGDAKRGILALTDGPAERLVTVDMIYEHFKDRIREDGRFAEFDSLVRRDLHSAAKRLFTDEGDRLLAQRVCDVLILNELAELEKPKSVCELATILLSVATEVSASANEQYLADVILGPLLKESPFLRLTPDQNAGKRIFRVSLERDSKGLLQKEVERVLASIQNSDAGAVRTVFCDISSEVPTREALAGTAQEAVVPWRGTQRRGAVLWAESVSFAEVEQRINDRDNDFAIVLCPPDFKLPADEPVPERAVYWIPEFSKDELSAMRRYYAVKMLAEDAGAERTVREDAAREAEDKQKAMASMIEAGFKRGKFVREGHIEERAVPAGHASGFIERLAARPVIEMLKGIHPKFLEVAPEVEFISRRTLAPLIEAIIIPGKITMAAARKNNSRTMIEGALIPMGLAAVSASSFVMQTDPAGSQLVKDTLTSVDKSEKMSELVRYLRRGEYGLSFELLELLVISLVHAGVIEIKKGGRRIPSGIVNFSHVAEAEEVCTGELLPAELKERLFTDDYLTRGLDQGAFSLAAQREAWERLLSARDRLKQHSAETVPAIIAVSKFPVFDGFDFNKARGFIERGLEAVAGVVESKGAAKGLAQYLSAERPGLGEILKMAEAVSVFAASDSERLVRIADYLRDMPFELKLPQVVQQALSDLQNLLASLTDIVLQGKTAEVFLAFDRFLELYTAWYAEGHRTEFAGGRFESIRRLRGSKGLQALSLASGIGGIHLVDDAPTIKKRIDAALSLYCERTVSLELRLRPRCGCGFMPGTDLKLEAADSIERSIENGLKEAIHAFSNAQVLERLVARISALRDIDPLKANALEELFHKLRDKPDIDEFVQIITPDSARLLDEALKREVKFVRRKVGNLAGKLVGRKLPPERIRSIFNEWLGDCGMGEVVVDLNEDGSETISDDAQLAAWIKDHSLDDAKARLTLVVPASATPAPNCGELVVDPARLKKMIELTGIVNANGDETLKLLGRERRCRSLAVEMGKQFINHLTDGWMPDKDEVDCHFDEVKKICNAAITVGRPISDAQIGALIRSEAGREYAMSFLNECRIGSDFPSTQVLEKLRGIMERQLALRDRMFANVQEWPEKFSDMAGKYPDGLFVFIDGARWDIVARLDDLIRKQPVNVIDENWYRVKGASTASWQERFFGTSDTDTIASMFKKHGVRYFADAERSDVRRRIREEAGDGALWLRIGSIDRLLHATSLPLCQFMDEAVAEAAGAVTDILPLVKAGRRLILLTDHGFSEVMNMRGKRYDHDPSRPSDALAAVIVYEGK